MKILLLYIPFKKVLERSRKTIISYAIFIHSGKFHILLDDSTEFQTYSKLLLAWKRKFYKDLDFSPRFKNHLDD